MSAYLRKYPMLLGCCIAACLLAACATTRTESLRASASRLDDASSRFSSQVQSAQFTLENYPAEEVTHGERA
jgi:hypothetical protein